MRSLIDFNDGWLFDGTDEVRLPHTAVELSFNYFDENTYQRAFTYEKRFVMESGWQGKDIVVCFEGAMANTKVVLNGVEIAAHADGYTPFEARLTDRLREGENVLTVTIDGSENPNIPPFGGQIDYLTYAGIYREVWLRLTAPVSIGLHKIETPNALADQKSVKVSVTLNNPQDLTLSGAVTATILDSDGRVLATTTEVSAADVSFEFTGLKNIDLWDINDPTLYTLRLELDTAAGKDLVETRFGFRTAEFKTDGFFLNGRRLQIRGLNRHQSFPYAGYALGRAAQIRDADILKNDLRLNLVRTSHYPQSTWFLDRCDEIGLLVFEEIPGWQHIGDDAWKASSVENVRGMIRRDWNHPSIIIWGVRINESGDDHDFYAETNEVARALDPTRQTGGVRCITDSEMLEDVYTMNDFQLGQYELGGNRPRTALRPQQECTGLDHPVPYMITEYNGHMFPTKIHDQEQRQAEHVIRHLEVMDAAYGDPQISGSIGWCAFDYNTHKDFGSGDRICYHGVMDMFREPKLAAHAYASQGDPSGGVVMEPVTFWTRGERNIQGVLPLIILTNCDEVEVCYGEYPPVRIKPDRDRFAHLPHAPVIATREDFGDEGLGTWGSSWSGCTINGFVGGKQVATRTYVADPVPTTLEVVPDKTEIAANDDVRLMIRALDQAGNKLPHLFEPVTIRVAGQGHRIGPETVPLRGGATGVWIRASGAGMLSISVSHDRFETVKCIIKAQ